LKWFEILVLKRKKNIRISNRTPNNFRYGSKFMCFIFWYSS
jgi:hypothetical protein